MALQPMAHEALPEAALPTAKAVANFFLTRGFREGVAIDQLKLQKLVFYAHAWHLGYGYGPLFPDDIEAWPHGPVTRDLYIEFKGFGRQPITRQATYYDGTCPSADGDNVPAQTRMLLESLWNGYKGYDGIMLSNSTHAPHEPWTVIKTRYGSLAGKPRIPNELIAEIFREKLNVGAANQNPAAAG